MKTLVTIIAVVLVALAIFEVGQFYWRVRIGRALAASAQPFERVMPEASFQMLIIGDSTAYGTGVADPKKSVAGLFGTTYPTISLVNRGKNGRKTAAIPEALEEFADGSFDLVLLHTGGNDIIRWTPLVELEQQLDAALRAAKETGGRVAVLHSGNVGTAPIFPYLVGLFYTARTRQVRDLFIRKTNEHGVLYVDLFAERANDPFLDDVPASYAADRLHLGPRGNRLWFEKIIKTLHTNDVSIP